MNKITVMVLNPNENPIVKTIEDDYKAMQKCVGGLFEHVWDYTREDDFGEYSISIWVNDEGRIREMPYNTYLRDENGERVRGWFEPTIPMYGPILFMACREDADGEIENICMDEGDVRFICDLYDLEIVE